MLRKVVVEMCLAVACSLSLPACANSSGAAPVLVVDGMLQLDGTDVKLPFHEDALFKRRSALSSACWRTDRMSV